MTNQKPCPCGADDYNARNLSEGDRRVPHALNCPKHPNANAPKPPEEPKVETETHGISCPKVGHGPALRGYLHAADDDGPYEVDGVWYCGRCHTWIANRECSKAQGYPRLPKPAPAPEPKCYPVLLSRERGGPRAEAGERGAVAYVVESDEEIAAKVADWQQVVLNGGPPCFSIERGPRFCLRAERWAGHRHGFVGTHSFVSLETLLTSDRAERESNNRAFVEMNAVFEAVIRAIRGEALSEFDESHGAVHEAKALRAAAQERDRQIAAQAEEIERLKGLLNALMEQHPKRRGWSEPPGHSHLVAGIWDHDNGAKAGTKCEWCAAWWAARAALKPESTGR